VGKEYISTFLKALIKDTTYRAEKLEVSHLVRVNLPFIKKSLSQKKKIDPNKTNTGAASLEKNISSLTTVVQTFLDVIISSLPHLPL